MANTRNVREVKSLGTCLTCKKSVWPVEIAHTQAEYCSCQCPSASREVVYHATHAKVPGVLRGEDS